MIFSRKKKIKLPAKAVQPKGVFPAISAFYPNDPVKALAVLSVAPVTLAASTQITDNNYAQAGLTAAALLTAWMYDRYTTRNEREGYLLDAPFTPEVAATKRSNANWDITKLLKARVPALAQDKGFIVTESRSHQYRILKIKNLDPKPVKEQMPAISMLLGIDQSRLFWIQNFKSGISAILVPEDDTSLWTTVPFTTNALAHGHLQEYIGESITKEPVINDRKLYPHMLVSGMTGAGKTEVFCNSIASFRASGLNPEIVIIDPKNSAQLAAQKADFYTADLEKGITKLERLFAIAQTRMDTYRKAGCANFFEYQAGVNPEEKPICIFIDEIAALLRENPLEELEKGDSPQHKRAEFILTTGIEQFRSSGMFLTAGLQNPKAKNLDTAIRDNFGARVIMATADENAGRTAGDKTADFLQMEGAFTFKTGRRKTIGRAAYQSHSNLSEQ